MYKKLFVILFLLVLCIAALSSCNEKHEWSEWELNSSESDNCEDKIYKRYCFNCNEVQLKEGSHVYSEKITYDKASHWYECLECGSKKDEASHTFEENFCTKCEYVIHPTEGIIYEVSEDGTYAIVVGYQGTENEMIIANRYNGLPVTAIGERALFRCGANLTSVVIPDSVTTIGEGAFTSCISLTSVVIGDSVTSIGNYAFYYCKSLISVVIPDNVTTIGECAFNECDSLVGVVISNNVNSIGYGAFASCDSLTSVTIPDDVTSIGHGAFAGCIRLTSITVNANNQYYKSIDGNLYTKDGTTLIQYAIGKEDTSFEIPYGVTSIDQYAFYNCDSLTSVAIPDGVTSIDYKAFCDCNSLASITVDENNQHYKSIDGNLYTKDKTTLIQYAIGKKDTSFEIPDSVTYIGDYAFSYCHSLARVDIPDSVTYIGGSAFHDCDRLASIVIGKSVTTIDNFAFYSCDSLKDVYYVGSEEQWKKISIDFYCNWDPTNTTCYYYSETEPTEDGNFWHWGENGEVVVWE